MVKNILLVFLLFVLIFVSYKAFNNEDMVGDLSNTISGKNKFVITVSGSRGTEFQGGFIEINKESNKSQSVDGKVPAAYSAQCLGISLSFQKQSKAGELEIRIMKNGHQVNEGKTSAEFGVVTLEAR